MGRDELKAWRCGHGHVMGMVRRNGSGIRELLLYREAVDLGSKRVDSIDPYPIDVDEVEVMAVVQGYVADVRCSVCGEIRTWMPGAEVVREMVRRYLAE